MNLTAAQIKLLQDCTEQHPIFTERAYPFPHRFFAPDRTEIGEAIVRTLVNEGYLKPKPQDKAWDSIHYTLTEDGKLALARAILAKQASASEKKRNARRKD